MTEKLVKTGNDYILYSKDKTVLGITSGTMEGRMLSLKNCQAIERGYDLDELADEHCNKLYHEGNINWDRYRVHFKLGFQKAIEILGDKKFSENDMKLSYNANEEGWVSFNAFMEDLLQQTEWDVEIVMDRIPADRAPNGWDEFPKLDEDGCLILTKNII